MKNPTVLEKNWGFCVPRNRRLDTGNYRTQLASAGFHERDLASVKNFNGKVLTL